MADRHTVPTHLDTPDGLGSFTIRQGVTLFGGVLVAAGVGLSLPEAGPSVFDAVRAALPSLAGISAPGALPMVPTAGAAAAMGAAVLFSIPRTPPIEHGAIAWGKYRFQPRMLGGSEVASFIGSPKVEADVAHVHGEDVAMWAVPATSLRLASDSARSAERARWAAFLEGIPCPIQTSTRSTPVDLGATLTAMRGHGSPQAASTAAWLRVHSQANGNVQRQRYLSIRAGDPSTLKRYADTVDAALVRANLRSVRLTDADLRDALTSAWTSKPQRLSIGPRLIVVEPDAIQVDGTWHATYAYQTWPGAVVTDFLANLYDGALPIDVHQIVRKLDRESVQKSLRDLLFKLEHTKQTRERKFAIKQLDATLDALETNAEHVFETEIYLQVHAPTREQVLALGAQVAKIVGETGGTAATLRWEQADAMLLTAGVVEDRLLNRKHRVDTSSLSRAYPWSASELAIAGGVPWGRTLQGNREVIWTPRARPLIPNPNTAVYGASGSGKGMSVKIVTARLFFAGQVREMFALDQAEEDEDGEYGRWARYCGGEVRKLHRDTWEAELPVYLADIAAGDPIPPVIALNMAELGRAERCRVTVAWKQAIFRRATRPGMRMPRIAIVDEMWSVIGDKEAESEVEDMVRRGRHFDLATFFMTQRAMDALSSTLGATVQSQCGTKLFCMQLPSEISDVQKRLRWTDEQVEVISRLGVGQAMIEAGLSRLTFEVIPSPDEYAMANTDAKVDEPTSQAYTRDDGPRSSERHPLDVPASGRPDGRNPGERDLGAEAGPAADLPLDIPRAA